MTDEIMDQLKRQGIDLEAVIKQTQGGSVLILTQLLANTLEHSLLRAMQPFDKKTRKALFRGMGAFSTLSAKIHIAYGIGLLDQTGYDDAHILRSIRNKFAHAESRLTLDNQEISQLLSKLSMSRPDILPKDIIQRTVENLSRQIIVTAAAKVAASNRATESDTNVEDD